MKSTSRRPPAPSPESPENQEKTRKKPGKNPKSLENLAKGRRLFSADNQPAGRGRKKFLKTVVAPAEAGDPLTFESVEKTSQKILGLSVTVLKDLARDQSQPSLVQIFSRALIEDYKTGRLTSTQYLLERAVGCVTQKVEKTSSQVVIKLDASHTKLL